MDIQDALRVLGVELGADRATVRRAYLKLVKRHRPERDPEGFQRVRAAYDYLSELAPCSLSVAGEAAAPRRITVASTTDSRTPRFVATCQEPHTPRVESPSTGVFVLHGETDVLAAYRERIARATSTSERERTAKEAVQAFGTLAAYELWIEAVDGPTSDQAVCAIAREAIARGHHELVTFVRQRCPAALTDAELDAWGEDPNAQADFVMVALELIERRRFAKATCHLVHGYAQLAREPLSAHPPAWFGPQLLLRLVEHGCIHEAARVLALFLRVHEPGSRGDPIKLEATRELVAIAGELDASLTRDIARALRADSPERADDAMVAYACREPERARLVAALMRTRAPMLAAFYALELETIGTYAEAKLDAWMAPS